MPNQPSRPNVRRLVLFATGFALLGASVEGCAKGEDTETPPPGVALIVKTEMNPFFVEIERTAEAEAADRGLQLTVAAGTEDGDVDTQIAAVDAAIDRGDKAILITPSGPGVDDALKRARKAGVFVVALDTKPTDPAAADITYATDNYRAGELIGAWSAEKMAGRSAVIAMLDLFGNRHVETNYDRDQGFLSGMGIPIGDYLTTRDETPVGTYRRGDYRIACQEPTLGAEDGGRNAMQRCLELNPDINLVYTVNEPAAVGAAEVLREAGSTAVLVSVDGGCDPGMQLVAEGVIGATAMQNPRAMARSGIDAVADFLEDGTRPLPNTGVDMVDTGVTLVTDDPQPGVPSIDTPLGLTECWGNPN